MAQKKKTLRQKNDEWQLRRLTEAFARQGITVRREPLSRGHSYRVKSGDCELSGAAHLFIDRRLPVEQQVSVLVDYLVDFEIPVDAAETAHLSSQTVTLLGSKGLIQTTAAV